MFTVFFDLETSDRNFLGQILNYSFVALDQSWEEVGNLSGLVRLSRLQLPAPSAILANRVDVLEHQRIAKLNEVESVQKISEFLADLTDNGQRRINLLGFNSTRFDVPYLRTVFYRNGANPYFNNVINYRDAFHSAKMLYLSRPDFPQPRAADNPQKLTLKLESLAQSFGLLTGAQEHEAQADVRLLIDLCKLFQSKFDLDPRSFTAYQVSKYHGARDKLAIVERLEPNYDLNTEDRIVRRPMSYLDGNQKNALWVDLNRYQESPDNSAIKWFNCNTHEFLAGEVYPLEHAGYVLAKETKSKFAKVNLGNIFTRSTCDIEQDVYRIDFVTLETLCDAMNSRSDKPLEGIKDRAKRIDATVLYRRYCLANYEIGSGDDEQFKKELTQFALRRYGGKAQLFKSLPEDQESVEGAYAPSLKTLFQELKEGINRATGEDRTLLNSLRRHYIASEIVQVAGKELGVEGEL